MDDVLDLLALNDHLPVRIIATALFILCVSIFRRKTPAQQPESEFAGNLRNNIYHVRTCEYGRRTGEANQQAIYTHLDASAYGFRPCKECVGRLSEEELIDGGRIRMISVDDPEATKAPI